MMRKMRTGSTIKYLLTIILCVGSFVFLCGLDWFLYKAELKNSNDPFIELSGSIGNSIGNAQSREQQELNVNATQTPAQGPIKPPSNSSNNNKSNVVRITIEGEKILIGNDERNLSDIKLMTMDVGSATRKGGGTQLDGKRIILVDDWADYTVYMKVKTIFANAGIDCKEENKDEENK